MMEIDIPASAEFLCYPFDEKDALAFVRRWCDALSSEDYETAYGLTAHRRAAGWTPELLKQTIETYDGYERTSQKWFKLTSLETASSPIGEPEPRHEVDFHSFSGKPTEFDGMILRASIWFDLPLNGAWSDLTATFDICSCGDKAVVILDQVHVF